MTEGENDLLDNVRARAADAKAARERLNEAIREARMHGYTLRAIADAAGLSHEEVRKRTLTSR